MSPLHTMIDPSDGLERQNAKLKRITEVLMRRVEQNPDHSSLAYAEFERAALLEKEVSQRTADLERTLDLLHQSNARLGEAIEEAEAARSNLAEAIETVEEGFALFDAQDRLVLHNSRFCNDLDDIRDQLCPGLPFERYVSLISRSRFLELPNGESRADWRDKRLRRHLDKHTTFNVSLVLDRWVQVSEHRTHTNGTVILQTDVTQIIRGERRERDRLMTQQAEMVRATLDHLPQGVTIFDRDGRLMGWNAQMEALLNQPVNQDVLGRELSHLLDRIDRFFTFPGDVDRAALASWAAQTTRRRPLTFDVERMGDQVFTVQARDMPDRGFLISFTDVTQDRRNAQAMRSLAETLERRVEARTEELNAALDEATLANASKTRFMAAATHDLLQPLSAAKLFVAALEDRADTADTKDVAAKAVSAMTSVETIIEALLDISKLDSGKAAFDIDRASLGQLVDSLRIDMAPLAQARGLDLRVVPSSLTVETDPVLFRRIVQNLVGNAIRHTTGQRVLLGVRRVKGRARVEVWDEGPGIAPDKHRYIFEEFRQLGPRRSGAAGLGLGLAIVDRACTMMSHDLDLWSEEGRGSCFAITLPILSDEAPAPSPPVEEGPTTGADGLVVALVENDHDLARALTLMIEDGGSDVIHSETAEEALALYDELGIQPDFFLVDHQLGPGMEGLALADLLRQRFPGCHVTLISADRSPDLAKDCDDAGLELWRKPLSRQKLTQRLQDIARSASR